MKAHFLPRTYLKGFVVPDTPAGAERKVWTRALPYGSWELKSPAGVAWKDDYYAVELSGGGKSESVERGLLQKIETRVAPLLRERLDSTVPLTEEDRGTLAYFVATTLVRVPTFRRSLDRFAGDLGRAKAAVMQHHLREDPVARQSLQERLRADGLAAAASGLTPEALEALEPASMQFAFSQNASLGLAFSTVNTIVAWVDEMRWTFLRTTGPDFFVTSDAPVCFPRRGFAAPDATVTLPLTRTVCLHADRSPGNTTWADARRDKVVWVNARTLRDARLLVAPSKVCPGTDFGKEE